ncbi:transposase [Nitrospira sp. Ecomares 2.1]
MGQDEPIERWTAKRRAALVLRVLKGETSVAEAARQHELTVAEVEGWQDRFLRAAENGLRRRPKDEDGLKEEQMKKLKQKIGGLVVENDVLREALKPYPLGRCKLPQNTDKPKVELSGRIDPGGSYENQSIQRNANCRDLETSRCRAQSQRPLSGAWDQ